jgi:UV DNA damage endonuclease
MIQRIGFACKLSERDAAGAVVGIPKYNTGTTTVSWLKRQTRDAAETRIAQLVERNLLAVQELVSYVSKLDPLRRMVRISSDVLPVFTHPDWQYFYKDTEVSKKIATSLAKTGEIARAAGTRLSFHPGQFCCIVSENPGIVDNSLQELEYHAYMAQCMGYGERKLDFKINVHLSGKRGVNGFLDAWNRMSPVLRSSLTLENDEYQAGLDALLPLSPYIGIVLDVHHHWINTGEYIQPTDPRLQKVRDSWHGNRPVIHYSQSEWCYLEEAQGRLADIKHLTEKTARGKLRTHSEFYNHRLLNDWALGFLPQCDIMCESKAKNLAVDQLVEQLNN